ncbi:unnamed protein product [Medioppia subpectinata]|uniref:Uncharacterized protein n=1 Tax=Medioppia subpectinata TaxID=1979941 RepID=A0A7R9KUX1_9ACAR|nr:unnamed protein product [Medioppia subpectinata]CAG2109920.1 unnamed protein product [Medioppia subpectinata]
MNNNYLMNEKEFAKKIFPRLINLMPSPSALIKSKLIKSALKAALIPKLVAIYETTNDLETRQLVRNNNPKVVKLVLNNNSVIDSLLRQVHLNDSNVDNVFILESLLLIQCLIYYSPHFETTSQVLDTLIQLTKCNDSVVISESLYTIFVFNERFTESRQLMITSKAVKQIIRLWIDYKDDETIVNPAFGIILGLVARHPNYRKHLLGEEIDLLEHIPDLVKTNEFNKINAITIISNNKIVLIIVNLFIQSVSTHVSPKGCLPSLCSQLSSDDEDYVKTVLIAIIHFLFIEYKTVLAKEKKRPNSRSVLSPFAELIRDSDGLRLLNRINNNRMTKESDNSAYGLSGVERAVGEILALAFGVETRPLCRQQSYMAKTILNGFAYITGLKGGEFIYCQVCDKGKKKVTADTGIFGCRHAALCRGCATGALIKHYNGDPKTPTCKVTKCGRGIPNDVEWSLYADSATEYYNEVHNTSEKQATFVQYIVGYTMLYNYLDSKGVEVGVLEMQGLGVFVGRHLHRNHMCCFRNLTSFEGKNFIYIFWMSSISTVFPRLLDLMPSPSALIVLQYILYSDFKIQKSKLIKSALKAALIPKLVAIYETTNDLETRQLVHKIYFVLCLVFKNNPKAVKLVFNNNSVINPLLSHLNDSNVDNVFILESLLLIQCLVYYSPQFVTTSQVLETLIQLTKFSDSVVIKSRQLMITSKAVKQIIQLWIDYKDDETIVNPAFGTILGLLARHPNYRKHLLGEKINLLEHIPDLIKTNEFNKINAITIIRYCAMRPFESKAYNIGNEIKQIIDKKLFEICVDCIQNDLSMKASKDQLEELAQALCSQLDSDDNDYLKTVLIAIIHFLFTEFKTYLAKEKKRPNPRQTLGPFANIIQDSDGLRLLNRINDNRMTKESDNSVYRLSDVERTVEEILALAFGVETRPILRQESWVAHTVINRFVREVTNIYCQSCEKEKKLKVLANTPIFECSHAALCRDCATGALIKHYNNDLKTPTCKAANCGAGIPADVEWSVNGDSYNEVHKTAEQQFEYLKINISLTKATLSFEHYYHSLCAAMTHTM